MPVDRELSKKVEEYSKIFTLAKSEIAKSVVGQEKAVNCMLKALIANGHVLLEGVPGIAKTLLVRTIARVMKCSFSRIQFTPDLLPTDIVGITAFEKDKGFYVVKGPIFANFVLADEINRAPPKVQSALLECMAERQATIGKESFLLDPPFFVLATQNPIESLGTYPLPEAQLDRFLFKLQLLYPTVEEEQRVLTNNITTRKFEDIVIEPVLDGPILMDIQEAVRQVYVDEKVEKYIVRIIDATRNPDKYKLNLGKFIEWGASPRGSIGLHIAGRAEAMLNGKLFVTPQDIKEVASDVLRHRIIVNYEGQAEAVKPDDIVKEILSKVPVP
ncbi:MAG: MoxR family ATPase [Candidatus Woesearchaeota archaeon]